MFPFYVLFFFFFFGREPCGILAPWSGMEHAFHALEGKGLTAGEVS